MHSATRAASAITGLLFWVVAAVVAQDQARDPLAPYLAAEGSTFALESVRVVDGSGAPAQSGMTILLRDGLIEAVGPSSQITIPADATRLDLEGHTALPGLVMMHEHLMYFSGQYLWDPHPGSFPKLFLAAGVTTLRTAGAESPHVDVNLKRRIDAGQVPGPRIHPTGPMFNGPGAGFVGDFVVADEAEAVRATSFWADYGATSFKVYESISTEALAGVVAEAHRRGLKVTGHLHAVSCAEAAELGIDSIEHSFQSCLKDFGLSFDQMAELAQQAGTPALDRLIATLVAHDVALVATPMRGVWDEKSELELSMLSPDQRQRWESFRQEPPPWAPPAEADLATRQFERAFQAAGGALLVGSDAADFGAVPGFRNHQALEALVAGGLDPLTVLRIATSDGARFLGVDDVLGSLAPGKLADLLIVRGAPDLAIEDIENVVYVFKGGIAFSPAKLREAAVGQVGLH